MQDQGRKRVVIQNVSPEVNCGRFAIKRVVGEKVVVQADIFSDGHDDLAAKLLFRPPTQSDWQEAPMKFLVNDRWVGEFSIEDIGTYKYTVQSWIDHFSTWQKDLKKKVDAGQNVDVDLLIGCGHLENAAGRATGEDAKRLKNLAEDIKGARDKSTRVAVALNEETTRLMHKYTDKGLAFTYDRELPVTANRKKALFSSWYEFFPRSCGAGNTHGTFKDCETLLPDVAKMGFDVIYLPPIHPIGEKHRKGKNNSAESGPDSPGSPWAIGAKEGGHKSIHPELGSLQDFKKFVAKAKEHDIDVAMDIAFQCAPDHPYVKEHPKWFKWRPDGSVQYAENPPKKYQDILPINFESEDWEALWQELRDVILYWVRQGIAIFRVDNPHTKPFAFWQWVIKEIRQENPEVIFLSEAFTRPKVMYRLAKVGFSQSYTYFTWRNTKQEFEEYLTELTQSPVREFFRPNFWPNTPDILPEHLQYGGRPAFMSRLVLAATLSSNYGIYGPAYELCENEAISGKEEYFNSEKYEIKEWNRTAPGNIRDLITRVNKIRKENEALQTTWNIKFYEADNKYLLFYGKYNDDRSNIILTIVNLDPFHTQSGWLELPLDELDIPAQQPYLLHDLLSDEKSIWQGERNFVELSPKETPARIFRLHRRLRREQDFDYFM